MMRAPRHRPDRLLPFLLKHMLIGIAIGGGLLAAILHFNVSNLGTLVANAGPVPLVMLIVMFSVTFGSANTGFAVMLMPKEEPEPPAPRAPEPVIAPRPALVAVPAAVQSRR